MVIVQIFFAMLLLGPMVWGVRNWIIYKRTTSPKGIVNYTTLINSAILYALAFNLIFFIQEVFLVIGKKAIGLKAFLYHNNHTWEGQHPMELLMQGFGALAIFLFGLICLAIFIYIKKSQSNWKLFLLWLAFHGLMQSLPQVTVAFLDPKTDVGEALVGYLNLSQPILIILALTSIFAIAIINIWFSKQLLSFVSGKADMSNPKAKLKYIRFVAVGAAFLGSLLIVPFRIPPLNQAVTPFVIFIFTIPWVWTSSTLSKNIRSVPNRINEKIYWIPIVFLILLLFFFQSVLAPGLEF